MDSYECIVVGGGAAGLSAALVLGRARRSTLVVDAGRQSNLPAHAIGGLIGQVGRSPAEFYAATRAAFAEHPSVTFRDAEVVAARHPEEDRFELELADGSTVVAPRLLLATGMEYRYPPIPGADERWGSSVFHCPFCHGWEVRDQPLAVLGATTMNVHRAVMLRAWSDDVTVLTNGSDIELEDEALGKLRDAGVAIDERVVAQLRGPAPDLEAVEFTDGSERALGGLLVPVTLHQRSTLARDLGATLLPAGPVMADAIEVDPMFRTDVPGLWAAGDASAQMPSITEAIAAGSKAGAMLVGSITGAT